MLESKLLKSFLLFGCESELFPKHPDFESMQKFTNPTCMMHRSRGPEFYTTRWNVSKKNHCKLPKLKVIITRLYLLKLISCKLYSLMSNVICNYCTDTLFCDSNRAWNRLKSITSVRELPPIVASKAVAKRSSMTWWRQARYSKSLSSFCSSKTHVPSRRQTKQHMIAKLQGVDDEEEPTSKTTSVSVFFPNRETSRRFYYSRDNGILQKSSIGY